MATPVNPHPLDNPEGQIIKQTSSVSFSHYSEHAASVHSPSSDSVELRPFSDTDDLPSTNVLTEAIPQIHFRGACQMSPILTALRTTVCQSPRGPLQSPLIALPTALPSIHRAVYHRAMPLPADNYQYHLAPDFDNYFHHVPDSSVRSLQRQAI